MGGEVQGSSEKCLWFSYSETGAIDRAKLIPMVAAGIISSMKYSTVLSTTLWSYKRSSRDKMFCNLQSKMQIFSLVVLLYNIMPVEYCLVNFPTDIYLLLSYCEPDTILGNALVNFNLVFMELKVTGGHGHYKKLHK